MTARTPTYLKSKFETNDVPTGSDFSDAWDSFLPVIGTTKVNFDVPIAVSGSVSAQSIWADELHVPTASFGTLNISNATITTLNSTTGTFQDITISGTLSSDSATINSLGSGNISVVGVVSAANIFISNSI